MVTGQVLAIEKVADDAYGRMLLWVIFTEADGSEHAFYSNGKLIEKDGHKAWPYYFQYEQIAGMDATALESWAQKIIAEQAENVIRNLAREVVNAAVTKDNLPVLIGKKFSIADAATAVAGVRVTDAGTLVVK